MKKAFTKASDPHGLPELTREQLGRGVRGKYHATFTRGNNVALLRPDLRKAGRRVAPGAHP